MTTEWTAKTAQLLGAKELIGKLILASYESGYYSATNQLELVATAVAKRKILRQELERRLMVAEFNNAVMSEVC